jgi:hypothetical protein
MLKQEAAGMPISYSINVSAALITTRCVGHVTVAEVLEHFKELPRVWPAVDRLDVFLDLRELTSLPTLAELQEVAAEIEGQIGPHRFGRCAVVTDGSRDLLHESMQMFEILVNPLFEEIRVFRSALEAVVWLQPKPNAARTLTPQ